MESFRDSCLKVSGEGAIGEAEARLKGLGHDVRSRFQNFKSKGLVGAAGFMEEIGSPRAQRAASSLRRQASIHEKRSEKENKEVVKSRLSARVQRLKKSGALKLAVLAQAASMAVSTTVLPARATCGVAKGAFELVSEVAPATPMSLDSFVDSGSSAVVSSLAGAESGSGEILGRGSSFLLDDATKDRITRLAVDFVIDEVKPNVSEDLEGFSRDIGELAAIKLKEVRAGIAGVTGRLMRRISTPKIS